MSKFEHIQTFYLELGAFHGQTFLYNIKGQFVAQADKRQMGLILFQTVIFYSREKVTHKIGILEFLC